MAKKKKSKPGVDSSKNLPVVRNNSLAEKDSPPPNHKQPDQKRSLLVMLLVVLAVNFVFLYFFKPNPAVPPATDAGSQVSTANRAVIIPVEQVPAMARDARHNDNLIDYELVTITTPVAELTFSNEGGVLAQGTLQNYLTTAGLPVELIPRPDSAELPFSLRLTAQDAGDELNKVRYAISQPTARTLIFRYRTKGVYRDPEARAIGQEQWLKSALPADLIIEKKFIFADDYQYDLSITISNVSNQAIWLNKVKYEALEPALSGAGALSLGSSLKKDQERPQPAHGYVFGDNVQNIGLGFLEGLFGWNKAGYKTVVGNKDSYYLSSRYFINILTPHSDTAGGYFATDKKDKDNNTARVVFPAVMLNPQDSATWSAKGYLRPKSFENLTAINPDFAPLSGIKKMVGIPLSYWIYKSLKFIHSFVGNYGLAIIILTILIKLLLLPLSGRSLSSIQRMQKLRPEMEAIKSKYADNQQKQAEEQMKLYKKHKVNPAGGCLPMLLQIPIFFSLYWVLQDSIALRSEPFITLPFELLGQQMWIVDLAAKDPTYILPILMGLSMFLQQKMSAVPGNDQQNKMMLWMTIFFTFMFMNFPAGLVLYWLVNNLVTISQQFYMSKKI